MIRILYTSLLCALISLTASAQKTPFFNSLRDNWKLEIKTGTVAMLTPIPDQYLFFTNNMNIPVMMPGPMGVFSAKKCFTAHIEMGYQLDYLHIQGKVLVNNTKTDVLTQTYSNTFLVQYNFKKNNVVKPLFNYFLYYKLGGISVKNNLVRPLPQGTLGSIVHDEQLHSNLAIMSGIGAGINYQINPHFSLVSTLDVNRNADTVREIFIPYSIISLSGHSVNNYIEFAVGLSWWFNFGPKKRVIKTSATKTNQQLIKTGMIKKKTNPKATNFSIWFNTPKGK